MRLSEKRRQANANKILAQGIALDQSSTRNFQPTFIPILKQAPLTVKKDLRIRRQQVKREFIVEL